MTYGRALIAIFFGLAFSVVPAAAQEVPNWPAPPIWNGAEPARHSLSEGGEISDSAAKLGISTSPLPFVGTNPCRVADTRGAGFTGAYGPPPLAAGVPRSFPLAGQCGIPASAGAVSLNITVTNTLGPGFILIHPEGGAQPVVSTLNYIAGQTVANAAIVALGTGGGVTVIAGVSGADLILDTNGYYGGNVVTNVSAGAGLTGGGTGDVTLGVNFGGSGGAGTASRSDHTHAAGEIVSGLLANARLGGTYSGALTFSNPGNAISGSGAGLTNLNAGSLASGTVPSGRVSGTYSGAVVFSNLSNSFAGSFSGDGSGLTGASTGVPHFAVTVLDSAGTVGLHTSMAIGVDGLGLISYHEALSGLLKVAHCSNTACTSATVTTLDGVGDAGERTSLTIGSDGLGLISYYDSTSGDLKVAHCSDLECTSATLSTLDSTGNVGHHNSITIGTDGRGLISYYDTTNGDLKVARCDNTACTGALIPPPLDTAGDVGQDTSITIGADGLGLISYHDVTNGDLKAAHCINAACTGATATTIDSGGIVGRSTSVTIGVDGLGLISYYDQTNGDLKVAHCSNVACTGATLPTLDNTGTVGQHTSVTIGVDGLGLISYHDASNGDLKVAHCSNVTCTSATVATLDSTGLVGSDTSVTIGTDGLGLVSYLDSTNADLKVAHCSNLLCTPFVRRR